MPTLPVHQDADAVLEALDPEQREVAAHPLGPMRVLAGAGTGKTRALTHRIAYGVLSGQLHPQRTLAVTFTARAAGELRHRLRSLGVGGVQARTFHAAALRQLHYFWPQAIGGAAPDVVPNKAGAVAEACGRIGLRVDRTEIRDLAAEIEWAKVSLLTPETYPQRVTALHREPPGLDATAMARVLTAYEEVKTERGVIDFEDVLLLTCGVLAEHDQIARAVRDQYRHFVVDEYQDVNALQQRLLDLWLGDRHDVCVVGDPAQTIYSFTGASPQHLLDFGRAHPGTRTVELVRNYRSTPQVVALANAVLSSPGGGRRSGSVVLRAQRPTGPEPVLQAYADDVAEAEAVATEIAGLLAAGRPASEIAVLFRTNAQSELLETALSEAEVPYLVRGGERFFSRQEVREAIVLLRGAARSDTGEEPLPDLVRAILLGGGWTREAPAGGSARARWESLAALAALADDLAATLPEARLQAFLAELDERAAAQHAPTVEGVTLASLHAAKGLEWDVVFLIGCSDGLLPIVLAEGAEAIEEERRLLYVGVTRAREQLTLSWAGARTPGARATRRVSRFLEPAAGLLGEGARSTPKSRRRATREKQARTRASCRGCGTTLDTAAERLAGRCSQCPPSYDEARFEQLRAWRRTVASERQVPAFVVFSDATLTALAEQEPTTLGELAGIPGIGAAKLEAYGEALLALLGAPAPP